MFKFTISIYKVDIETLDNFKLPNFETETIAISKNVSYPKEFVHIFCGVPCCDPLNYQNIEHNFVILFYKQIPKIKKNIRQLKQYNDILFRFLKCCKSRICYISALYWIFTTLSVLRLFLLSRQRPKCSPTSGIFLFQIDLDGRLGCSWHVVVGEDFGFDITFEVTRMLRVLQLLLLLRHTFPRPP